MIGCGGQLSGSHGNFTSPNYPRHYSTDEVFTSEESRQPVIRMLVCGLHGINSGNGITSDDRWWC